MMIIIHQYSSIRVLLSGNCVERKPPRPVERRRRRAVNNINVENTREIVGMQRAYPDAPYSVHDDGGKKGYRRKENKKNTRKERKSFISADGGKPKIPEVATSKLFFLLCCSAKKEFICFNEDARAGGGRDESGGGGGDGAVYGVYFAIYKIYNVRGRFFRHGTVCARFGR